MTLGPCDRARPSAPRASPVSISPASSSVLVRRPPSSPGTSARSSTCLTASSQSVFASSDNSPIVLDTASRCGRRSDAASGDSPPIAAGNPATTRASMPVATVPSADVSVPRTDPYRCDRTSAGSASMSCAMSASWAARWSSAVSNGGSASGRSASSAFSMRPVMSASGPGSAITQLVAADSTVVPYPDATTIATANSGCHWTRQPSLNVPVPEIAIGFPHGMPRIRNRWSNRDFPRSVSLRRSSTRSFASGAIGRRNDLACWRRSASSGTRGASSGTVPSCSPITRSLVTNARTGSAPLHITARADSCTSSRPATGRPRITASVSASLVASMAWALDTGRSCRRSTRATSVNQRATTLSSQEKRCWYQPGDSIPAP